MAIIAHCPIEAPQEIGGQLSRWNAQGLSVRDRGVVCPGLSFHASLVDFKTLIERHCGLKIEIRTNQAANLECFPARIDGPSGVLARFYLPGRPSQPTEQRTGEWDKEERYNKQSTLDRVTLHELCHGLGLVHHDSEPSIMNSMLSDDVFEGGLDEWTITQLRMRHQLPNEPPPEPEPPTAPAIDWIKLLIMLIEWWTNKQGRTLTAAEIAELEAKAKELVG